MTEKSTRLPVSMSEDMKEELEDTADRTGLSMSAICRLGIYEKLQELGANTTEIKS